MTDADYRSDIYAWASGQADAARRRSANELDWDNVAEELDGVAKDQEWQLYNRYVVLLTHLLKWRHQPGKASTSWRLTIRNQRLAIAKLMRKAPSLKAADPEEFADAYQAARGEAARQTRLSLERFPEAPPFTADQARDPDYLPPPIDV